MRKTKININDIQFDDQLLPNGNLAITARIVLQATSEVSTEMAGHMRYRDYAEGEIRKRLIRMVLTAAYGDVWDLASYVEMLITRDMPAFRHADIDRIIEMLTVLGRIGKADDDINALLEPYRNPEGRSGK